MGLYKGICGVTTSHKQNELFFCFFTISFFIVDLIFDRLTMEVKVFDND